MGRNTNYACNMLLNDSDSNDNFEIIALLALEEKRLEREMASTSHCGSVPGRRFIQRDHEQGHQKLFQDYFAESSIYPPNFNFYSHMNFYVFSIYCNLKFLFIYVTLVQVL